MGLSAAGAGKEKRKYLPAEAYRFLVLAALAHRRGAPATKGQLAWEARANHTMITRVLRELDQQGLVRITEAPDGAYQVTLTPEGEAFHAQHRGYFVATFRPTLEAHYRFGARPRWAGLD